MTPERWQQVRQIFHEAVDLPLAARQAFLHRSCKDDGALLREVISLLAADREDDFLEVPAVAQGILPQAGSEPEDAEPDFPARIGSYRIDRLIARGGMGAVYLAFREGEFTKKVALKVIKRGMDTRAIVRRFRNERQILAHLDHPGIARLLDGGTTATDVPYLVMEHIEGEPITQYCDARHLSVRARLELMRLVCAPIQFAHQNLIVHRDLKPSNILVTPDGQPKLLDFGIAKIVSPDASSDPADQTLTAMRLMTPDYASPEQCRGDAITTASDVYSLGVLLYVLLSGQKPYRTNTGSPDQLARLICEQDPERPSVRAAVEWPIRTELDGDLDAIVLKAIEKRPAGRYLSVAALSDDLHRYLAGLPVQARRITAAYRAGKFVRRHRWWVSAAALFGLSVGAGIVATAWQWRVARVEYARAETERSRAERRFNDVRRLAGTFLFEFNEEISELEGALPARHLVIKRGLEYLQGLGREAGADPSLRIELARAYSKLGQIRGDYYHAGNIGDFAGAVETYGDGIRLLDSGGEWPAELRAERASVAAELHAFKAETLGVMGAVAQGLSEIAETRRWQETYAREYALQHGGARAPLAWLKGQHDLSEADLLVMSGDIPAALATLEEMRLAIDTLYAPTRQPLSWGTNGSRIGAALHILATSVRARLGDSVAERALLVASLDNQRRAYESRTRAVALTPKPTGGMIGFPLQLMGHAAFALGRVADGHRWIAEAVAISPKGGQFGFDVSGRQWRARHLIAAGDGRAALRDLQLIRPSYERAVASAPVARHLQNGMAGVDEDEGDALWLAGDRRGAEARYRGALALRRQLVVDGLTNGEFASSLVYSTTHFASRLMEAGRQTEARVEARASLDLLRVQADAPGADASRLTEYAWLLLVAQPADLRNPAIALDFARRALDRPRGMHPDSVGVVAVAQYLTGDVDGAITTALRAYELVPEMRAGRSEVTLRRDIRENLRRHPLKPLPRPVWF